MVLGPWVPCLLSGVHRAAHRSNSLTGEHVCCSFISLGILVEKITTHCLSSLCAGTRSQRLGLERGRAGEPAGGGGAAGGGGPVEGCDKIDRSFGAGGRGIKAEARGRLPSGAGGGGVAPGGGGGASPDGVTDKAPPPLPRPRPTEDAEATDLASSSPPAKWRGMTPSCGLNLGDVERGVAGFNSAPHPALESGGPCALTGGGGGGGLLLLPRPELGFFFGLPFGVARP